MSDFPEPLVGFAILLGLLRSEILVLLSTLFEFSWKEEIIILWSVLTLVPAAFMAKQKKLFLGDVRMRSN